MLDTAYLFSRYQTARDDDHYKWTKLYENFYILYRTLNLKNQDMNLQVFIFAIIAVVRYFFLFEVYKLLIDSQCKKEYVMNSCVLKNACTYVLSIWNKSICIHKYLKKI
jgi:uncharacterized membrane protein